MQPRSRELYHFTCLLHLPSILREGLREGEVPTGPGATLNAPNFTTNPDPRVHQWAAGSVVDKLKVRLLVEVPTDRLESWLEIANRRRIDPAYQRRLDPHGQGDSWFVYWGQESPDRIIEVDIRVDDDYYAVEGEGLTTLVDGIEAERSRIRFNGDFVSTNDDNPTSWLFDGGPRLRPPVRIIGVGGPTRPDQPGGAE